MRPTADNALLTAALRINTASRLVVLTGAGVSKESGIPTFREAQDGLWARYDPMEMASEHGFLRNPRLVWEWYEYRFGMVASAQPNPGHLAIAALEDLVPTVTVVTQNIDGLHQAGGSTRVLELHGSIRRYKCFGGKHTGYTRGDLAGQSEKPPRCPQCGDLMRPDIVWFGEYLPEQVMRDAYAACLEADTVLVVGTSGVVQPAASLPFLAQDAGATVIDVNPEPDEISGRADIFLQGMGGSVLPSLIEAVRSLRGGKG
jgi:NAD-dependent deacetylase